ncbi:MAG: cytochrome c [Campylobacterota bacterium]|nr:cytochrome c [Campylobacterota bacterium]
MKKATLIILPALIISLLSASAMDGEALFEAKCAACHLKIRPDDTSKMKAPPAMGITRHVKQQHPQKEDAVKFIVDYVQNPTAQKAACTPQSIERFGLMPSMKGVATQEEFTKIAEYLYDNFGNRGQGRGKGQGRRGQGRQ